MYIYVCVYMYIYVCIYICVYIYTYIQQNFRKEKICAMFYVTTKFPRNGLDISVAHKSLFISKKLCLREVGSLTSVRFKRSDSGIN